MPIKHPSILRRAIMPAAALFVGSALAISAADGQTARTVKLEGSAPVPRDFKQVDVRPRGLSNGDHFIAAITLRAGNRIAGRAHVTCTIIDRRYQGQDCNWVLVFRDGTITASGGGLDRPLPGQATSPPHTPDEYAITGGTGAYRAASGTLAMQGHDDDSSTITLSL